MRELERAVFEKAVEQATDAAKEEKQIETRLRSHMRQSSRPQSPKPIPGKDDLRRTLLGQYGKSIWRLANGQWRQDMQKYAHALHDERIERLISQSPSSDTLIGHKLNSRSVDQIRHVLKSVRARLEQQAHLFDPEYVFLLHDRVSEERQQYVALIQPDIGLYNEEIRRCALPTSGKLFHQVAENSVASSDIFTITDPKAHMANKPGHLRPAHHAQPLSQPPPASALKSLGGSPADVILEADALSEASSAASHSMMNRLEQEDFLGPSPNPISFRTGRSHTINQHSHKSPSLADQMGPAVSEDDDDFWGVPSTKNHQSLPQMSAQGPCTVQSTKSDLSDRSNSVVMKSHSLQPAELTSIVEHTIITQKHEGSKDHSKSPIESETPLEHDVHVHIQEAITST